MQCVFDPQDKLHAYLPAPITPLVYSPSPSHTFLFSLQHQQDPVSLREFMQCVFDPQDKLDEIAIVFAWNYFALLSTAKLKELAPLYSETSVSCW